MRRDMDKNMKEGVDSIVNTRPPAHAYIGPNTPPQRPAREPGSTPILQVRERKLETGAHRKRCVLKSRVEFNQDQKRLCNIRPDQSPLKTLILARQTPPSILSDRWPPGVPPCRIYVTPESAPVSPPFPRGSRPRHPISTILHELVVSLQPVGKARSLSTISGLLVQPFSTLAPHPLVLDVLCSLEQHVKHLGPPPGVSQHMSAYCGTLYPCHNMLSAQNGFGSSCCVVAYQDRASSRRRRPPRIDTHKRNPLPPPPPPGRITRSAATKRKSSSYTQSCRPRSKPQLTVP